jgi:hypothetical protein
MCKRNVAFCKIFEVLVGGTTKVNPYRLKVEMPSTPTGFDLTPSEDQQQTWQKSLHTEPHALTIAAQTISLQKGWSLIRKSRTFY